MSLLCIALSAVVLLIAGRPLANYVISYGKMIITDGAPGYQMDGELINPIVGNGSSTTDQSEIRKPALNTQYGTILCEQIALNAPLYYGDDDYSLQNGAGQYALSGLPGEGKPILIGGHDGTYFKPLKDINMEDIITIKTIYGEYRYQVTDMVIADADDTSAYNLTEEKEKLILYTCYPFDQLIGKRDKRYFVYCELISDTNNGKE